MLLPRSTILGVALLAALAVPTASALGDDPPSVDIGMHVTLIQVKPWDDREASENLNGPPTDIVPIGDSVGLRYSMTNPSGDPVTVTFDIAYPPPRPFFLGGPGGVLNDGEHCDGLGMRWQCTLVVPPQGTRDLVVDGSGSAPGEASVTGSVSSNLPDPDPSNNTVTWTHQVTCQVNGTDGDDVLIAHAGQAACGFGGNDTLIAQPNSLGLFGGAGNDTLNASWYDAPSNPITVGDGGPGYDTVTVATAPNPVFMCGSNWDDYGSPVTGIGPADAPGIGGGMYTSIERVIGSRFSDWLVGTSQPQEIDGGAGNDVIIGGGGKDILDGNGGNDRFVGRDRMPDRINGGKGSDRASVDRNDQTTSTQTQTANPAQDPCIK